MVFALETYWPAADGWSAARIEEEVVVTASGCEIITKFPAEELLVAGRKYWTAGGALNTLRESQSHLNTAAGRGESEQRSAARAGRCPMTAVDASASALEADQLLALYEEMALIRATEKAAHDLFLSGLVKGTTHLAAGHEAVAVGASAALRPDDYVFATYRGHHHAMARGATPVECLAELMSKSHRPVPGQGRLDAPDQGLGRDARLVRDRRRAPADRRRGRLVGPAARHRPGRGRVLRRRRHQHRGVPRGAQPVRGVGPAGAVHLREQPLHGVHPDPRGDRGGRPRRGPGPGLRDRPPR